MIVDVKMTVDTELVTMYVGIPETIVLIVAEQYVVVV
jgi:hypothetical protein